MVRIMSLMLFPIEHSFWHVLLPLIHYILSYPFSDVPSPFRPHVQKFAIIVLCSPTWVLCRHAGQLLEDYFFYSWHSSRVGGAVPNQS